MAKRILEPDLLRSEYLKLGPDEKRKRNFLIERIINIWMPYLEKRISNLPDSEKDEVLQIYRLNVLKAIDNFKAKNGASFKSYLYYAARSALARYLEFNNKTRREHKFDTLETQTHQTLSYTLHTNFTFETDKYETFTQYISSSNNISNNMYSFDTDFLDPCPNCVLARL
jgi:DNA-directed RNA polymerase specialized sigma subunit